MSLHAGSLFLKNVAILKCVNPTISVSWYSNCACVGNGIFWDIDNIIVMDNTKRNHLIKQSLKKNYLIMGGNLFLDGYSDYYTIFTMVCGSFSW